MCLLFMKGDVCMSNNIMVKKNLDELRKRANKRSISFSSNPKSINDVKIENDFFQTMEKQIYKQIARN